eukprot:11974420-Alexandrium_andersonii.AAC.1
MASPIVLQGSCPGEINAVQGHRFCMPLVASKSFSRQRVLIDKNRFARAGGYGRVGFGACALPP